MGSARILHQGHPGRAGKTQSDGTMNISDAASVHSRARDSGKGQVGQVEMKVRGEQVWRDRGEGNMGMGLE